MSNPEVSKGDITSVDCRKCNSNTRHEIVAAASQKVNEWFADERETWAVIRCLGCLTYAFLFRHDDFDQVEEDFDGELIHAVKLQVYPSVIKNHRPLHPIHHVPQLIRTIYQQTLTALSQHANVLASIGLRATIEAVCNHLEISGTNLQRRIDFLFKAGYVSNGDKKRLHAIRFLGNDAAHEIKQPKTHEIRIALEIVEHLLNTVFILESRAKGLETIAENYPEFIKLLETCASSHKTGTAINLVGLLGKQKRLVATSLETIEQQLIEEIDAGGIEFLKKSTLQTDGEKPIQLYEVNLEYFKKSDDDFEDIPF